MKQYISVVMLAARSSIYKILGIFALMAALELPLFYRAMRLAEAGDTVNGYTAGLAEVFRASGAQWVCAGGFVLLCAALALTGCSRGGGQVGYTLRRLTVGERTVTLLWGGYNAVCLLVFWAFQLGLCLAMCALFTAGMPPALAGQTAFVAFYSNSLLHSLLPLAEGTRYVRNIALILALGAALATLAYHRRRGRRGMLAAVAAIVTALVFPRETGSFTHDLLWTAIALAAGARAVYGLWKEAAYEA